MEDRVRRKVIVQHNFVVGDIIKYISSYVKQLHFCFNYVALGDIFFFFLHAYNLQTATTTLFQVMHVSCLM